MRTITEIHIEGPHINHVSTILVHGTNVQNKGVAKGDLVNERTSCVWTRMTQQPSSHPVASWWARRETSSVDSNYRYPTRTTPGSMGLHEWNAIYMLQVLIALHGCDRSASFAAGHEFVDISTWKGRRGRPRIGWYHRQIAGCSSNIARHTHLLGSQTVSVD